MNVQLTRLLGYGIWIAIFFVFPYIIEQGFN